MECDIVQSDRYSLTFLRYLLPPTLGKKCKPCREKYNQQHMQSGRMWSQQTILFTLLSLFTLGLFKSTGALSRMTGSHSFAPLPLVNSLFQSMPSILYVTEHFSLHSLLFYPGVTGNTFFLNILNASQTTWHHMSNNNNLYSHHSEKLASNTVRGRLQ